MAERVPTFRGQGNERFGTDLTDRVIGRGQTVPYDVNGAPTGATGPAAGITFTPAGNIASTNVQAAIEELDAEKVPVATLTETVQDLVGAMVTAGANISVSYNDPAGTLTIAVTGLAASNISDFSEAVDDRVAALLVAGANINLSYNDGANTLTIAVTGLTSAQISDFSEAVDDRVASLLVAGGNISLSYNDAGNALTIAVTGLGTAAAKNTGTSGNTIPLLDGAAPTWTNGATFGGSVSITGHVLSSGGSFAAPSAGQGKFYGGSTTGATMFGNGSSYDNAIANRSGTSVMLNPGNTGDVQFASIGTTASAANAYLDSGASNNLLRSTSNGAYKTDIIDLDDTRADKLFQLRPIRYRSLAPADDPAWSFYGLLAEEVAAIDPRLVHWGFLDEQLEVVVEDGVKVRRPKAGEVKRPDSVQYDRLTVLLLNVVKRQRAALVSLTQRVGALEAKVP